MRAFQTAVDHWDAYLKLKKKLDRIVANILMFKNECPRSNAGTNTDKITTSAHGPIGLFELFDPTSKVDMMLADQPLVLDQAPNHEALRGETNLLSLLFTNYNAPEECTNDDRLLGSWNLQFLALACLHFVPDDWSGLSQEPNEHSPAQLVKDMITLSVGEYIVGHPPTTDETIAESLAQGRPFRQLMLLLKRSDSAETTYRILVHAAAKHQKSLDPHWLSVPHYHLKYAHSRSDGSADIAKIYGISTDRGDTTTERFLRDVEKSECVPDAFLRVSYRRALWYTGM